MNKFDYRFVKINRLHRKNTWKSKDLRQNGRRSSARLSSTEGWPLWSTQSFEKMRRSKPTMATGRQAKHIRSSGKDTEQRPLISGNGGCPAHEKTNASESDRERPSLTDRVGKDAKREWATFNKTKCAFTCRPSDPAPRTRLRDTPPTTCQGCANGGLARVTGARPPRDAVAKPRARAPSAVREPLQGGTRGGCVFSTKEGEVGKRTPHA